MRDRVADAIAPACLGGAWDESTERHGHARRIIGRFQRTVPARRSGAASARTAPPRKTILVLCTASLMTDRLTPVQLDAILALQLSAAWAGEAAGARLGWWKTDLFDSEGGGDFFGRLAPKTAAWASMSLLREAARRVDSELRARLATGDRVWTLFHFGFLVDEQLSDRMVHHRNHRHEPHDVFGEHFLVGKAWSAELFLTSVRKAGTPKVEVTSVGRKVLATHCTVPEAAQLLFGALAPLTDEYPLPFMDSVE